MGNSSRHIHKMRVWYGTKYRTPTELPKMPIFLFEGKLSENLNAIEVARFWSRVILN